ncbi:MAG: hypothetical protein LBU32_22475 [Clostridiales bacterium]|jgi:hypothetical protein|nr:hypothetical protein [Clostridiales bacterium]
MLRHIEKHPEICVDGVRRKREKHIGYCWCSEHKGYLTTKLLREHCCLEKKCSMLQKLDHTFWIQRERMKAQRRAGSRYAICSAEQQALEMAREYTKGSPHIVVTNVKVLTNELMRVAYIGNRSEDLSELAKYMGKTLGKRIWIRHIQSDPNILDILLTRKQAECGE